MNAARRRPRGSTTKGGRAPSRGPARGRGRFPNRIELLVLLAVAVVRAVHWAGMLGDPLAGIPSMDPQYHDLWAQRIAEGHLTFDGPFFRAPLYPYVLGLLYAVSGNSIAFAEAVQLALGLLSVFLLFRIGARAFGVRVGLIAGAVYGVYPVALRTEGDLLVEGLFILFVLGALLALLRALERPGGARWFVAGVLLGLAAITRPTILLFAVAVPAVAVHCRRRDGSGVPVGRGATEALLLGLGLLLPVLPVTLHNVIVGRDFVPIASQGGVNFYIGNNPRADGFTAIIPGTRVTSWEGWHHDTIARAEQAMGRTLRASEVSDYYMQQGMEYLLSDPGAAFRLYLRKLYLFWWGAEISNNRHEYFLRRYSWPLRLTLWHAGVYFPFGVVAPLALLGMVLAWRRGRGPIMLLLAYVALYMISVIIFFTCARFRLPAIPILLLFAVYGGTELPGLWRRRSSLIGLLAVAGALLLLNADPYRLDRAVFGSQALSYIDLGLWNASERRMEEAVSLLERAVKEDPTNPIPHAWLGRFALQRGDVATGEAELRLALRGDPNSFRDVIVQAQSDLGRIDLKRGDAAAAREKFRAALALDGESKDATTGMGFASLALGDTAAARSYLERALALDPGNELVRGALSTLGPERP